MELFSDGDVDLVVEGKYGGSGDKNPQVFTCKTRKPTKCNWKYSAGKKQSHTAAKQGMQTQQQVNVVARTMIPMGKPSYVLRVTFAHTYIFFAVLCNLGRFINILSNSSYYIFHT